MIKLTIHIIIYVAGLELDENDSQTSELKIQIARFLLAKGININCLNFAKNHLHILFQLPLKKTITETHIIIRDCIKTILELHRSEANTYRWSDNFIAYSVSSMLIELEESTIIKQSLIHQMKSFEEEADSLLCDEIKYYYPR